jgi:hypothetical protein
LGAAAASLFGFGVVADPGIPTASFQTGAVDSRGRLRLVRGSGHVPSGGEVVHLVSDDRGEMRILRLGRRLRIECSSTGDFLLDPQAGVATVWAATDNDEALEHRLASLVLPVMLSERGDTALHASGVLCGGLTVALAGPSGAGKSTLAGASALPVVSEDGLVLTRSPAGFECWPGPLGVRLLPDAMDSFTQPDDAPARPPGALKARLEVPAVRAATPLAGIVFIEPRRTPGQDLKPPVRVKPVEAVPDLLRSQIFAGTDRTGDAFHRAARLADGVPVWRVSMPNGLDRLRDAFEQMLSGIGLDRSRTAPASQASAEN